MDIVEEFDKLSKKENRTGAVITWHFIVIVWYIYSIILLQEVRFI